MWVFLKIEHISSTAVPGVAAGPAIDLMGLPSTTSRMLHPTEQCSPTSVSTPTTAGRLTGRCASAQNGVSGQILHVVTLESWPTRNQRILRDQRARARLAVGRRSRIGDHGCVVGNVTPTAIISERRITGLSAVVIAELVSEVRPLWHERHQARLASRSRKRAVGAGAKHRMVCVDRPRWCPFATGVLVMCWPAGSAWTRSTVTRAIGEVRPLLAERGCMVSPDVRL
ncbi:hypothetical protein [Streptomyces sp. NBC_01185]|uniref:hypothetical protein n=1 Tax=Streptomyces sp. NBC_01185 TaxID=2903764 RepID=UPI00386D3A8C